MSNKDGERPIIPASLKNDRLESERRQEIEKLKVIARESFSQDLAIMLDEMRLTDSFSEQRNDDGDQRLAGKFRCLIFVDPFGGRDPDPIILIAPKTITLHNPPYKDMCGSHYTSESGGPGMFHNTIYAYWLEIAREYPRTARAKLINELDAANGGLGREHPSQCGYVTVGVDQDRDIIMELQFDQDQVWNHGEEYYKRFMRSLQQDYGIEVVRKRDGSKMEIEQLIREDMFTPIIEQRAKMIENKMDVDTADWYRRCARLKYINGTVEADSHMDTKLSLLEGMLR